MAMWTDTRFLPVARDVSIGKAPARVIRRNESEAISEADRATISSPWRMGVRRERRASDVLDSVVRMF